MYVSRSWLAPVWRWAPGRGDWRTWRRVDRFMAKYYEAIHCTDYFCTHHNESIQVYYDNIITACINAAADTIPVKGNSSPRRSIAE